MYEHFKFEREDVDEDYSLNDWITNVNKFTEFEVIYYTLKSGTPTNAYNNANEFVGSILSTYNSLRSLTSIRVTADIHNPDDSSDTRYGQNIRFEIEDFTNNEELKES